MAKAYATTYTDGDQAGCSWSGTKHLSTSTRSAQSRAGGRVIDVYESYSIEVASAQGLAFPPLKHNTSDFSILPGALLQTIRTEARPFALIFEGQMGSLSSIHTRRDQLIELLKPDLVTPLQPLRLRWTGATDDVEIEAYYLGGLEGDLDGSRGVTERLPARFIAYQPFWYSPLESAATLTTKQSVSSANCLLKKVAGLWSNLGNASMTAVYALAEGKDGLIYIGGDFQNIGSAGGDGIISYNPSTGAISALGSGTGGAGGGYTVYDIEVAPNGDIIAAGDFTLMGGVAGCVRIARWNGSVWSPLGGGMTDTNPIYDIAIGQDGTIYLRGAFTNFPDANGDLICLWNGSSYASMGTGMTTGARGTMAVGLDGSLYVSGRQNGVDGIHKWASSAWSLVVSCGIPNALVIDPRNGDLYAFGGQMAPGGLVYAAKLNGSVLTPLGTGLAGGTNYYVKATVARDGAIHVIGDFTSAGGLSLADHYAIWNGSTWLHPDVDLPGSPTTGRVLISVNGDVYLGFDTNGTATTSALTTVTNSGSAAAYPKIVIKRTGGTSATAQWIKNETTGKTMWVNYALLDGETLTIDLTPGNKKVTSSFFGNVIGRTLLPGSDFADWCLLPGSNSVSVYISDAGSPTLVCYLTYKARYWSPDGAN